MTTRIKSSQILDGSIVASDFHSAIQINTTASGTFGSVIVGNYTLGNNRISTSQASGYNGDIMFDASGDIILDADGSTVSLKDNGLNFGQFYNTSSGDFNIYAPQADKHIKVLGNDGGSTVTALDFDMEHAGRATFNENIVLGGDIVHAGNLTIDADGDITLDANGADIILADNAVPFGRFKRETSNLVIKAETVDKDIIFRGIKSGSPNVTIDALVLDMSNAGDATFSSHVKMDSGSSTGKFAVMSTAVHGSYDFYNNGTSYFNDTVTVDGILEVSGSSGVLRGPSTFTIDPAVHGANSGTVVIAGDLQVDGTTTTINSTTLTVDDKNITLASGSNNKAAATGAGLTADLGSDGTATFAYDHTQDRWQMNKGLELLSGAALTVGTGTTDVGRLESVSGVLELNAYTGRQIAFGNDTNGEHVRIDADGQVGIGNNDPQAMLHVSGTGAPAIRIQDDDGTNNYADMGHNGGITTFVSRNNTSNGSYIFYGYNGTTFDPLMTLDPAGRLGINQTPLSNNFALQVTGMQPNGSDARVMYLKGAGTSTSIGSTGPTLVLQNTDTTANNIVKLSFESASAGETVSINAINTNHSSHYGDMAFNTRGSAGYSEKMRIMANGEVGIGTNDPDARLGIKSSGASSYPLLIKSSDNQQLFRFREESDTRGTFYINDASENSKVTLASSGPSSFMGGNVGIGTDSPGDITLKVHSNDSDDYIAIFKQTHASNLGTIQIDTPSDSNARPSRLDFARGGVNKWKTGMVYGDSLNGWGLSDATGSGTALQQTRFLVTPTGKVSIGTSDPGTSRLKVYNSTVSGNTRLHVHNDKNGDAAELRLEGKRTSNNDTGQLLYVNSGNVVARISANSSADDGDLRFYTSATGTGQNIVEAMRIATTGQVNIGQTPALVSGNNPRHVLHIGGTTVNPSYEQLSMSPGSVSGGENATRIRMANVGNDFYLTNNYYNWGTHRFDETNEGQAFFKMLEDGRFSFGGRSSASTSTPSYNAAINGNDGSISAGSSMTMVNGMSKMNVVGNSDTSDEDVELRMVDYDDTTGSAIPTISFYKGSSGGPVKFASLRANDVLGFQFRDGSNNIGGSKVEMGALDNRGVRRQTASNNSNVGVYETSMQVNFAPSAAKYFRIQMDGNIAAGLSLHVSGDYGNVNAIGSFEKRYVIGTNAVNTGNYGTASTTICDIGPTSSKISLGNTSKPNATTLYIPVVNLDSNYSINFHFVATLRGEVGGITSIDMIAQ
jgi:hypothetical protein